MVHALLAALAKAGKLDDVKEVAKKSMSERIAKAKEKGMDLDED